MQNKTYQPLLITAASLVLMAACAGNPPAWWDPSGVYSKTETATSAATPTVKSVVVHKTEEIPTEEHIDASQDEYEEMKLSPLSSVEQQENAPALPEPSLLE